VSGQSVTFTATGTALSALVVNVTGKLERSETVTVSVVQDGTTLAPSAVTLTLNPADGGQVNSDGTIKLLKTGSLIIHASAGARTGSTTLNVASPPLIVFDLVRNFTRQIWQVAIDGGDLVQLTKNGSDNQHPSRVGNRLVFASARNGNAFDIFSMNMVDSSETRLTTATSSERDPNLSPNGNRIVYVTGQSGLDRAVYSNVDGTGVGFVDDVSNNTGAIEITPAWSPGSDKVIFSTTATGGTPDLWIQNSLGGFAAKMPSPVNTGSAEVSPVWSTTNKIAFHTTRSGGNEIWITDPTGATATKLVDGAAPAWLPDGRLVFVRFTGTTGSLFWVDPANPSTVHPIEFGGGDAQRPSAVLP
jgi:Tol biopolymer transport system component